MLGNLIHIKRLLLSNEPFPTNSWSFVTVWRLPLGLTVAELHETARYWVTVSQTGTLRSRHFKCHCGAWLGADLVQTFADLCRPQQTSADLNRPQWASGDLLVCKGQVATDCAGVLKIDHGVDLQCHHLSLHHSIIVAIGLFLGVDWALYHNAKPLNQVFK